MLSCKGVMLTKITERLNSIANDLGLSQTKLANIFGVSQSSVSAILRGESLPKIETVAELCKNANVNANWLLNEIGPKYLPKEYTKKLTASQEGGILYMKTDRADELRKLVKIAEELNPKELKLVTGIAKDLPRVH